MRIRIIISLSIFFLMIFGSMVIYQQHRKIQRLSSDNKELIELAHDSARVAKTYINLYGQAISKNKVLDLSNRNLKALIDTKEFDFLKQIEGVKKNGSNLDGIIKIDTEAKFDIVVLTKDTTVKSADLTKNVPGHLFSFQDKYNTITGIVLPDSTTIKGRIAVPILGAIYWQRKHKFIFKNWRYGKKIYQSELYSPNPWVSIIDHEFIKVSRRKD